MRFFLIDYSDSIMWSGNQLTRQSVKSPGGRFLQYNISYNRRRIRISQLFDKWTDCVQATIRKSSSVGQYATSVLVGSAPSDSNYCQSIV